MLKNDRLLRALRRQPVDTTPIWLMRQAGRYLPEYRQLREQAGSFMNLCQNPELACEVTLQPLRRFDLDAAILFSDILTIPEAMGLGLYFVPGEGPHFERPLRDAAAINKLGIPDPETELRYVPDAVRLIRRELNGSVPLIGFAGSPWTLATYMVEGGPSKTYQHIKALLYDQPQALERLLATLADSACVYLNAQIAAGAQALQIFDSWGGVLTTSAYQRFSLAWMQRILQGLQPDPDGNKVPVIVFTKGGNLWLEQIAASGCDAVSLDWTIDIGAARQRIGQQVALQGNMDPALLYASPDNIRSATKAILDDYGPGPGHVFNLGHGVTPQVNPEHVNVLVESVHAYGSQA